MTGAAAGRDFGPPRLDRIRELKDFLRCPVDRRVIFRPAFSRRYFCLEKSTSVWSLQLSFA